ncbi:response regulator [Pedobacter agri]|uniref:response regulator n=1 Tax=Pedobacter agri TaxID=454586 RepID=UPI00277F1237|nr:response regulator [Pedobacter agri]MDQ1139429.1 DNA-binding response OmpR family regulator [Pedobacter agri]
MNPKLPVSHGVVKLGGLFAKLNNYNFVLFMKRVLIIDDDEAILEVTKMALEMYDFEVSTLVSTDGASDAINNFRPDVILLDYNIGDEGNGRKFCNTIKLDPSLKHIKVIMFSALIYDDLDFSKPMFKCFDDYVPKPYDIDYLIEKVSK